MIGTCTCTSHACSEHNLLYYCGAIYERAKEKFRCMRGVGHDGDHSVIEDNQ